MRFPDIDTQCCLDSSVPPSVSDSKSSGKSSVSDSKSTSPLFTPPKLEVVDTELGYFAQESSEKAPAQRPSGDMFWMIAIVVFIVLGLLAWAVSMVFVVHDT
jgi:hypothetical protein